MCFSASASFIASGGLAVASAATLGVTPRRRRFLVFIPLVFAIQQALEGYQWILLNVSTMSAAAGYGYLAFAYVFWPVAVPLFVMKLDVRTRNRTRWFLGLGTAVAAWNLAFILLHGLTIRVLGGHITYGVDIPYPELVTIAYVAAVCGALLCSRKIAIRVLGVLSLVSAIVAYFWFSPGFPSVWCYFAAVISVFILWSVWRGKL